LIFSFNLREVWSNRLEAVSVRGSQGKYYRERGHFSGAYVLSGTSADKTGSDWAAILYW
jgi:hypothetical protein